ncbi:GNAT family N-acetyltransferase [Bordetella trematum]|uniref:GNAT family N-acetyltransferase n=1 Tax=Bordetella trematum TaxID=123899 RepID=UPI000D8C2895|nr:GNAT family N-acetyltransferase [Bordetella trematum]SPU49643.1 acetyltransferase [Bordetella trematum]VDH07396.1 ribosomal-protein-alanine N-acetyltransferase [Bordetella trematum]
MKQTLLRPAVPEDARECLRIRGLTRENAYSAQDLEALGITVQSWRAGIENGSCPGYVAHVDGQMAGYCFADRDSGEILVLALLPAHEGQGLGRALLERMIEDMRWRGFKRLFLACNSDPKVRSHGFYRHLGWEETGQRDEFGDDILAYRLD